MKTESINNLRFVTPKTTGYAAAASMGLTVWSGVSRNKILKKQHKALAYLTAFITALHIGLTEYLHNKYKKHN